MIVMGPKKPKMKIVTIRLGHMQQAKIIKFLLLLLRPCLEKTYFKKKKTKTDAIQPSKDPLKVPVGPVTRLRVISSKKLSMDFFKRHGLRWALRGFVIIKSKP
jgi:hypothetical protein